MQSSSTQDPRTENCSSSCDGMVRVVWGIVARPVWPKKAPFLLFWFLSFSEGVSMLSGRLSPLSRARLFLCTVEELVVSLIGFPNPDALVKQKRFQRALGLGLGPRTLFGVWFIRGIWSYPDAVIELGNVLTFAYYRKLKVSSSAVIRALKFKNGLQMKTMNKNVLNKLKLNKTYSDHSKTIISIKILCLSNISHIYSKYSLTFPTFWTKSAGDIESYYR